MSFIIHEHIQKIRLKELIFILIIAIIVSALLFLNSGFFSSSTSLIISMLLLVFGMNFLVYVTKKSGTATIFYTLVALFTFWLPDIGILGWKKVLTFFLAGIIFELIFLYLKLNFHSIPLDMVVGTTISITSISIISSFLISAKLAGTFPLALINFILLSFSIGLFSSVIFIIIWHNLKRIKHIIQLQVYLSFK